MIETGLAVSLASDYNPGSSPSGNMNFIWSLACVKLKMLPTEALNALTYNAAYAMEIAEKEGSIEVGKKANLIITDKISSLDFIPYSFGNTHIYKTIIDGRTV
jgi:imidazolonepropionase